MMDTGAGWEGVLSMMNVETKEVFVSDRLPSLYPGVGGRMKRN
jgi:serine/threonine protein phosphatase 1